MSIKLGYKVQENLIELSSSSFHVQALEKKVFKLFVYDLQTTTPKLLTVRTQEIALVPNTYVTVSLDSQYDVKYWNTFDTIVVPTGVKEVPLYVSIHNKGYTEASTSIRFNLVIQNLETVSVDVDYYGVVLKDMYTYLSRPVEQTLSRILEIDVIPKDSPYKSYLAYSNGSLLLLDNGTGIPYIEEDKE